MTNAQIVFNESVKLMEKGLIKGTGQFVTVKMDDGTKKQLEIPESIHTFAAWKSCGRQVKKGQHAIASFTIWKHAKASKKARQEAEKNGDAEPGGRMFMKNAFFFTFDQTEPIKKEAAQ